MESTLLLRVCQVDVALHCPVTLANPRQVSHDLVPLVEELSHASGGVANPGYALQVVPIIADLLVRIDAGGLVEQFDQLTTSERNRMLVELLAILRLADS